MSENQVEQPKGNSRPFLTRKTHFNTFHAQQCFKRSYDRLSKLLSDLSHILPSMADENQMDSLDGIIDGHISQGMEKLSTIRAQLEEVCESNGIDPADAAGVRYTAPVEIEARITSPKAGRYLTLVTELDKLVGLMHLLLLNGLLSEQQTSRGSYEAKVAVLRTSSEISKLGIRALRAGRNRARAEEERRRQAEEPTAAKADAKTLAVASAVTETVEFENAVAATA